MKLGAENPTKTGIAAAMLIGSVLLAVYMFSQSETPAAPAGKRAATPAQQARRNDRTIELNSNDPSIKTDLLASSEQLEYEGGKRNIFEDYDEPPPIPNPVDNGRNKEKENEVVNVAPPVPQFPPINLKFYGFASKPGEEKKVFLSQGEDIFVGKEGDIINRRYRILSIKQNSIEVEDVLYKNKQTLPLTQS